MSEGEVATSLSSKEAPAATNSKICETLAAKKPTDLGCGLASDASWLTDDEEADETFLDREGRRRHEEFYNAGYRDGVTAGRNDAAQYGFDEGFKDSLMVGYKWGIVRGVTSALAHIPSELKLKLVESEERRKEFLNLYEKVDSFGTDDALKLFCNDIQRRRSAESSKIVMSDTSIMARDGSELDDLESYFEKLDLLEKTSIIDVQLELNKLSPQPI